jgi:hypothetical protein
MNTQPATTISARDVLARPSDAQIRAAAEARVRQAMRHIENAQNELAAACSELSAITGGCPTWRACNKLTDRVHAFWYRVQEFSFSRKYSLDSVNVEGLARRLATYEPERKRVAP